MWNKNKITEILNIKFPIIQAGMAGGITTPELVATVSNSGALGSVGAGYMSPEQMRESIREIKKQTDKPFAVNIFVPESPVIPQEEVQRAKEWLRPYREELGVPEKAEVSKLNDTLFEELVNVIIEESVPVCSFTFGLPSKDIVQRLKQKHIVLIGTATTVEEAIANEKSGMDLVVVQGSEAGGHRGTFLGTFEDAMIGTMSLVPQVVDRVNIPVIAAGGIMDGRGVLSALVLGARGVQMGTAFVTSSESGAHTYHKDAILNSTEDLPVITSVFSGKPARGIRNEFIKELSTYKKELPKYPIQNALTQGIRQEAAKQGRPEWMSLWCGQNPRSSNQQSAGEMVTEIIKEVKDILGNKIKKW